MTTMLMSSVVDGVLAALGISAALMLLISSLMTSETWAMAEVDSRRPRLGKPARRAA